MVLVIRMKSVTRFLLFAGSLIAWFLLLVVANDLLLDIKREEILLAAAFLFGVLQTWLLAYLLHT